MLPVAECKYSEENKDPSYTNHQNYHHHDSVAVALFYYTNMHNSCSPPAKD